MRLVSTCNKFVKYVHVYKTIEAWGYSLRPYPPTTEVTLEDWQIELLIKTVKEEAKELGLLLRH